MDFSTPKGGRAAFFCGLDGICEDANTFLMGGLWNKLKLDYLPQQFVKEDEAAHGFGLWIVGFLVYGMAGLLIYLAVWKPHILRRLLVELCGEIQRAEQTLIDRLSQPDQERRDRSPQLRRELRHQYEVRNRNPIFQNLVHNAPQGDGWRKKSGA